MLDRLKFLSRYTALSTGLIAGLLSTALCYAEQPNGSLDGFEIFESPRANRMMLVFTCHLKRPYPASMAGTGLNTEPTSAGYRDLSLLSWIAPSVRPSILKESVWVCCLAIYGDEKSRLHNPTQPPGHLTGRCLPLFVTELGRGLGTKSSLSPSHSGITFEVVDKLTIVQP